MKKTLIIILAFTVILTGCSKRIKPQKVIKTDFDLSKAGIILKRAWKPVHEMTDFNRETRPDAKISSKEEFFKKYDFSYMDDRFMQSDIYDTLVEKDKDGKVAIDDDGNIVFEEGNYIPNVYDEGVFIKRAYIRDKRYKEEHSFMNVIELVIDEGSNYKESDYASNFGRSNIFRKKEKGEWVLYVIIGTMSIRWDR